MHFKSKPFLDRITQIIIFCNSSLAPSSRVQNSAKRPFPYVSDYISRPSVNQMRAKFIFKSPLTSMRIQTFTNLFELDDYLFLNGNLGFVQSVSHLIFPLIFLPFIT